MQRLYNNYILSLLSGILFTLAWPANGFAGFLFIAFLPLLFLFEKAFNEKERARSVLAISYPAFLIWNVGTTWWVYKATLPGAIMAFVFNALFMAIVFSLAYKVRACFGKLLGYLGLTAFWLGFEYLHLQWDLSWPWLTLGNGFASSYTWVQWYEFTGVFGGGFWIILVNILFYESIIAWRLGNRKFLLLPMIVIVVPLLLSVWMYRNYQEQGKKMEIAVIQPNIDPYGEKFAGLSQDSQLKIILDLASSVADSSLKYIIAPETALPEDHREEWIKDLPDIQIIKDWLRGHPGTTMITGLSSSRFFKPGEPLSSTARKYSDESYYDMFNTSAQIDSSGNVSLYHKSKLVPGVEQMPYPGIFKFVENFAIDLGGTVGSYGRQKERSVFSSRETKVAVPICYESIYGEFISEFIRNGAHFIFIITNDGWWGDTPGYRQHKDYARLRAIETRRSIARSANTGISCFINQKGDVILQATWWKRSVLKESINANTKITFYTEHGDYIAKFFSLIAIALLLVIFATYFIPKRK